MFGCNYCHRIFGHHPRCPLFEPPKASHYCSICDGAILNGEDYIKNTDGEYIHEDCVTSNSQLLDFLGGEAGIMEDCYE